MPKKDVRTKRGRNVRALDQSMQESPEKSPKLVFVVRLFSEITIKSAPVRKRWTKLLAQNLRTLGRQIHDRTSVVQDWDRLEVRVPDNSAQTLSAFIDLLGRVPGISTFAQVKSYPLQNIHDIFEKTLALWAEDLSGKTFCVRVKRTGSHEFTSTEVERYVGGGLLEHSEAAGVKLKAPDITVRVEIKDNMYYVLFGKYKGLGGFPLGTQEPVLSLVSGGFDSTVASYQMIRRGMRTHYCFFNLGGRAHEVGVKEIAFYLWRKYGASHRVKFYTVPFEAVVAEILAKINPSNMGVVLKRMMFRAAEQIAERAGIDALVTGEAISQVSSQTIHNLSAIDKVVDTLVLRPLAAAAKPDIIDIARDIGVEDFAANIPEYCGVISVKPSAKVNLADLEEEETRFDFAVLEAALNSCLRQNIDDVVSEDDAVALCEEVSILPPNAVLVDIRHPDEVSIRPLVVSGHDIMHIPFYKLNTAFEKLDTQAHYYLYCEKGVMSGLHASHLKESGFLNTGVYRPK